MAPLVGLEAPDAVRRLPGTQWAGQDAHEAELRFNAAPTAGCERDVGSKTTLRLLNSRGGGGEEPGRVSGGSSAAGGLMASKEHHFLDNPLYDSGGLVAWDQPRTQPTCRRARC
ncbi:unnamed protein product [Lepidochelys olivacea]